MRLYALLAGIIVPLTPLLAIACFDDSTTTTGASCVATPGPGTATPSAFLAPSHHDKMAASASSGLPVQPLSATQETGDIVDSIPWPDPERSEYNLKLGDNEGTGVLTATRQGDTYELFLGYQSGNATDESVVIVDAETLKPSSVRREICNDGSVSVLSAEYNLEEEVVTITEGEGENANSRPERLEDNVYDNESSFFLWRTIDFIEGFEAAYHAVLVNQGGEQPEVTLRLVGKEWVHVPAGSFEAWRLEVESDPGDVVAWFADTPARPMVRYENENIDFVLELTSTTTFRTAAPPP